MYLEADEASRLIDRFPPGGPMPSSHEPEGVDFVVERGPADPEAVLEVSAFLGDLKQQPGYEARLKDAYERLARLGMRPAARPGIDGPDPLLEHWERTVERLKKPEPAPSGVRPV